MASRLPAHDLCLTQTPRLGDDSRIRVPVAMQDLAVVVRDVGRDVDGLLVLPGPFRRLGEDDLTLLSTIAKALSWKLDARPM
jgi:hypothetical protein